MYSASTLLTPCCLSMPFCYVLPCHLWGICGDLDFAFFRFFWGLDLQNPIKPQLLCENLTYIKTTKSDKKPKTPQKHQKIESKI
ncbi:hypothetical protein [Helicobacter sp. T3_23-1059]